MKASTLLAVAVAAVVGLGAAGVARYTGLLKAESPPAPADQKKALPKVLVSSTALYKDVAVYGDQIRVRELRPDEVAFYEANRNRFLSGPPSGVHLRVPTRTVAADQPLLEDYFQDLDLPKPISTRLEPGTRSVNVTVEKDRGVGGVVQVGEYVDVLLTTVVGGGNRAEVGLRTACIARECKVVMKRNNLLTVLTANPDGQPLHYTLQANPYRAALLEYAQGVGHLTLVPVPAPVRKTGTFTDPTSREYADEDSRIEGVNRGELAVGPTDLVRLLQLKPTVVVPPLRINHFSGVKPTGYTEFGPDGRPATGGNAPSATGTPPAPGGVDPAGAAVAFTFTPPQSKTETQQPPPGVK